MPSPLHAKESNDAPDILVSYGFHNSDIRYIQNLKDGFLHLKDKTVFKINAKIKPVTEPGKIIFDKKILSVDGREVVCIDTPCQKKWEFDLSKDDINLMNLPYLHLAWRQEIKGNTPDIHVAVYLKQKTDNSENTHKNIQNIRNKLNINESNLKNNDALIKGEFLNEKSSEIGGSITAINLKNAEYIEKSRLYLAKRELGLGEDKKWRYSMDGSNLVIQSRVDIPLKNAQALKLYYKTGSEPVRVSLSIDKDGDMDRDCFIQYEQMDKKEYRENHRNVLFLNFSRALRNAGVNIKKGHLLEPIIFMHQDIASYKRDKPIEKIVFGVPNNQADNIIIPRVNKTDTRVFLDFNFGKASNFDKFWNYKVRKLVIRADFKLPQVFSWQQIMFFDAFSQSVPWILLQPEIALEQQWIGNNGASIIPPHEYIKSFKPLFLQSLQNIKKTPDDYGYPDITNTGLKNKNIGIYVSHTWYKLKENKNNININGIFTSNRSWIKIIAGKFPHSVFLKIQKENIDYVIVKSAGRRTYNLPFSYLAGKRGLYLDKGDKLILLVKNNIKKYNYENNNIKKERRIKEEKYRKWKLNLSVSGKEPYGAVSLFVSHKLNIKPQVFMVDNPVVHNKLLLIYHGSKSLKGFLDYYDSKNKKKSLPVFILGNETLKYLNVGVNSRLLGFRVSKHFHAAYDMAFIDLRTGLLDNSVEKKSVISKLEWWGHKGIIKLRPASKGIKILKNGISAILYNSHEADINLPLIHSKQKNKKNYSGFSKHSHTKSYFDQNQWIFTLDNHNFLKFDNIKIDTALPFGCSGKLIVNGKTVNIDDGDKNYNNTDYSDDSVDNNINELIDLKKYLPIKTIVYKIYRHDNKKIFQIKIPEISVTGIQYKTGYDAGHLKIKIDDKTIPIPFSNMLSKKDSSWMIPMGQIEIAKGEHFIETFDSKYFRIASLMLETDAAFPFTPDDAVKKKNTSSVLLKFLIFGVKFCLFAGFIFLLYLFRKRITYPLNFVWGKFKNIFLNCYWFIPDEAWALLWFLGSAGLYTIGILSKSSGENYATTFAGIFMVVFLWHISRLLKVRLLEKFPAMAVPIYRSPGSQFFAWAILFLIITALFVAAKLEPIAEQTAIIVYYCLVVGVVTEIFQLKRQKADKVSLSD